MHALVVVSVVSLLAWPVLAQAGTAEPPSMDAARLGWAKAPSLRDLSRHYPRRAKVERLRKGMGKVHCTARANGALACTPGAEDPAGYGFGEAAVAVMRPARVRAMDGGSPEGRRFAFTLKFGDWQSDVRARVRPPATPGLAWAITPVIDLRMLETIGEGQLESTVECVTQAGGALECRVAGDAEDNRLDRAVLRGLSQARVVSTDGDPVEGRRFTYRRSLTRQ